MYKLPIQNLSSILKALGKESFECQAALSDLPSIIAKVKIVCRSSLYRYRSMRVYIVESIVNDQPMKDVTDSDYILLFSGDVHLGIPLFRP